MPLDEVKPVAQHVLQPSNEFAVSDLESPWKLGPMDHMVLSFVPIEAIFVYRTPPSPCTNELLPLARLKLALLYLLDYYPHLTGRLQFTPDERPEITRLGTGAELLEAHCDSRLEDFACTSGRAAGRILMPNLPNSGNDLIPPFDMTMEGVCRDPIFAIKHTRFACGGVILGMRLHHIVCDAHGFFQLARDLAEIYRTLRCSPLQKPTLANPPVIRSYLSGPDSLSPEERDEALKVNSKVFYAEDNFHEKPKAEKDSVPPAEQTAAPRVTGRVLRFTGHDLQSLKQNATDPSGTGWISTFEALSAYLFQQVYRARVQYLVSQGIRPSEAASQLSPGFWASMDIREHIGLPAHYFPNAIYPPYSYASHNLLVSKPLWEVAKFLHTLIRSVTPEMMDQTAKWIACQPDRRKIKVDYSFANGSFTVSQWAKFDIYVGMDFDVDGEGDPVPPALVSPPFTTISRVDGLGTICSTEEGWHQTLTKEEETLADKKIPPAIDVNLTVNDALWGILDRDEEFRGFCCCAAK